MADTPIPEEPEMSCPPSPGPYCPTCGRPKLLDLYCGAGGASVGYDRAGFCVTGVDKVEQPRYPFRFVRADALAYLREHGHEYAAVVGSPPCQRYSDLAKRNGNADEWPDLVGPTRDAFRLLGLPWVIENVEGAPFDPERTVWLCGTMPLFPELRVQRHRGFEPSPEVEIEQPPHLTSREHPLVFTYDKRKAHFGMLDQDTSYVQVTGGGNATVANKRAAMGIDWMNGHELNEAIPPAFTEYVGASLLRAVRSRLYLATIGGITAVLGEHRLVTP